eukprot:2123473-Rhodomonas_salina.4
MASAKGDAHHESLLLPSPNAHHVTAQAMDSGTQLVLLWRRGRCIHNSEQWRREHMRHRGH